MTLPDYVLAIVYRLVAEQYADSHDHLPTEQCDECATYTGLLITAGAKGWLDGNDRIAIAAVRREMQDIAEEETQTKD